MGIGGGEVRIYLYEALLSTDGAVTYAVHVGNESSMEGVGFQRPASRRQCTGPRFCGFEWTCQGNGGPMFLKKMALSSGMEFLTIAAHIHSLGSWPSAPKARSAEACIRWFCILASRIADTTEAYSDSEAQSSSDAGLKREREGGSVSIF